MHKHSRADFMSAVTCDHTDPKRQSTHQIKPQTQTCECPSSKDLSAKDVFKGREESRWKHCCWAAIQFIFWGRMCYICITNITEILAMESPHVWGYIDKETERKKAYRMLDIFLLTDSEVGGSYMLRGGWAPITHLPWAHRHECFLCSLVNTQKGYCNDY